MASFVCRELRNSGGSVHLDGYVLPLFKVVKVLFGLLSGTMFCSLTNILMDILSMCDLNYNLAIHVGEYYLNVA